jgi:hypothetical protein
MRAAFALEADWEALVRRYPQHVTNRKIFDAQLRERSSPECRESS